MIQKIFIGLGMAIAVLVTVAFFAGDLSWFSNSGQTKTATNPPPGYSQPAQRRQATTGWVPYLESGPASSGPLPSEVGAYGGTLTAPDGQPFSCSQSFRPVITYTANSGTTSWQASCQQ